MNHQDDHRFDPWQQSVEVPPSRGDKVVCDSCQILFCDKKSSRCALTKIHKLRQAIATIKWEAKNRTRRKQYFQERYQSALQGGG